MKFTKEGIAVVESDTHLSKWIEEHGTLEVAEGFCRLFSRFIPEGGTVLDIGACLGDMTSTFSKMVGIKGNVIAYEPNPVAWECLVHNMKPYLNTTLRHVGLGEHVGTASAFAALGDNLGGTQLKEGGPIVITTLDYEGVVLDRCDFIKIDAEGWEPAILKGGLKTIAKFKPVILVEINLPILEAKGLGRMDVLKPLMELKYAFEPAEPHLSWDLPMLDVLCIPPK